MQARYPEIQVGTLRHYTHPATTRFNCKRVFFSDSWGMKTHYLLNDALKSSFHNGSQTETTARTTGEQLRNDNHIQLLSI